MEIWFEFASSYSYLAVMRVEAAARAAGVGVCWRPFLLGPVFLSLGWNDSPFNIYPAKGRYMWRDMERLADKYNMPLKMPTQFPRNGLLACRVAHAGQDQDWVGPFSRAAMAANFAEDRDISDRAVAPENKASLHAQNERAVEQGLFGAPSFIVDGELFWGNDRLEDALAWASRALGRL